jgi:hypothetical protein
VELVASATLLKNSVDVIPRNKLPPSYLKDDFPRYSGGNDIGRGLV